MFIRYLTTLLLSYFILIPLISQDVDLTLYSTSEIKEYFQEITIDVHPQHDSTIISISHAVKQANDSTFRLAVYRHISFEGELLHKQEYLLSKLPGSAQFLLESYNFVTYFGEKHIYVIASDRIKPCENPDAVSKFRLLQLDYQGELYADKFWCKDQVTTYSSMHYHPLDSTLYVVGNYGNFTHSLEFELTKIGSDFSKDPEFINIKSKITALEYCTIQNDTLYVAGTFNPKNTYYGPVTTWFGHIEIDTLVTAYEYSYYDDWILGNFVWEGNTKQYMGSNKNQDVCLLYYEKDKLKFSFFEGYHAGILPASHLKDGYIIPFFSRVEYIISYTAEDPFFAFAILDDEGFLKEKIIRKVPELLYASKYIRIGNRFFVFAKINNNSTAVKHKVHVYLYDLEE